MKNPEEPRVEGGRTAGNRPTAECRATPGEMAYQVVWSLRAIEDVDEIAAYIAVDIQLSDYLSS